VTTAEVLSNAYIRRERLSELPAGAKPATLEEAYAAREQLVPRWLAHLGGHVIGYKIGCTSASAAEYLGLSGPFYGNLFSALTFDSPVRLPASRFFQRVIESEFAFRIGCDLAPGASRREIEDAIDGVIPGIEIADSRYTSWRTMGAFALIADAACHGGWIRGPLYRNWRDIDLAAQRVELHANGKLVGSGSGAAVLGHPLNALEWLVQMLGGKRIGLKAGEFITTGVTTETYLGEAGDRIHADFGPVGSVELAFD
jgi:2-keto-4-pentenoate hydratase